jgi:hypothetical protein
MKKILFILLTILTVQARAQVKIALTGGVNFNTISWKAKTSTVGSDTSDYAFSETGRKQGFNVGVLVNIHVAQNFFLETGLGYTQKGGTTDENLSFISPGPGPGPGIVPVKRNQYFAPTYMQVPLYLLFLPEFKNKYKITGGAGLHISYGIGGQYYSNTAYSNNTNIVLERDIKFGNSTSDDVRKIEIGYGARIGFLMNDNLEFSFSAQRSFSNNVPTDKSSRGTNRFNTLGLNLVKYIKR